MDWIKVGRQVVTLLARYSVGKVVTNGLAATTPIDMKPLDKVLVPVGSFILGAMIGDKAAEYVGVEYDGIFKPKDTLEGAK